MMKIIKTADGKHKIVIDRKEWESIGRQAQWTDDKQIEQNKVKKIVDWVFSQRFRPLERLVFRMLAKNDPEEIDKLYKCTVPNSPERSWLNQLIKQERIEPTD